MFKSPESSGKSALAFLVRCPECSQFQVCVFDLDSPLNLKCQKCGAVFPSVADDPIPTPEAANWSLALTLREYEFEPPEQSTSNLVVVQDLPSIYPKRKRRRRRKARRRLRVPARTSEPLPAVKSPVPAPDPESIQLRALPDVVATEEAGTDRTAEQPEQPMAAVASLRSEPPLQWMYRLPPVEFNDAQPPNLDAGDDEFEYGRLELNWQSIVALLLLVTGLVSAWVTVIAIAFWPAILLTLVMSAFALRASLREGRRLLIPTATAAIAVVVTIASLSFSGNGGLTGPTGPLPAAGTQTTVIPFPQFASDPDVRHAESVNARKASIKQGAYRVEIADAWAGSSPETGSNHYLFVLVRSQLERRHSRLFGAEYAVERSDAGAAPRRGRHAIRTVEGVRAASAADRSRIATARPGGKGGRADLSARGRFRRWLTPRDTGGSLGRDGESEIRAAASND